MPKRITDLPSRFEPLASILGEKVQTTFIEQEEDLVVIKRLIARVSSSNQSKLMFIYGSSGSGKTTFIHSIGLFLGDIVDSIIVLPPDNNLSIEDIPGWIADVKVTNKIKVINFDAREAPDFNPENYRTFIVQLNAILRARKDIIILWPVNNIQFAEKIVEIFNEVGGKSPFGKHEIYNIIGLAKEKYKTCLDRILQVANWRLEDAAVEWPEIEALIDPANNIGSFLDQIQEVISERFEIDDVGIVLPKVAFVLTSSYPKIRDICRNLRRADSYYIEASRLMMYTKRSNVSEWWNERNANMRTALPYVVAMFDAQLISVSGSGVVHSILQFGSHELKEHVSNITANMGNAKRVVQSSELYKYSIGQDADSREYGLSVKEETKEAYEKIQALSKTAHKEINECIMNLIRAAGGGFGEWRSEQNPMKGLFTDVITALDDKALHLEFHHKAENECINNKVSIYILEKLKEYSINYGLAKR